MLLGGALAKNKKDSKETIEQERNMLKITLHHLVRENEILRQNVEDLKITARSNKELLKEYVETITGKDKVVDKMNNTIEQLQSRLHSLEDYVKSIQTESQG
jgi:hypothetical protein